MRLSYRYVGVFVVSPQPHSPRLLFVYTHTPKQAVKLEAQGGDPLDEAPRNQQNPDPRAR